MPEKENILKGLLDCIIPGSSDKGIPSAGSIGITEFIVSKFMESEIGRDRLSEGIEATKAELRSAGVNSFDELDTDANESLAAKLESKEPEFFYLLRKFTYMGYYTHPDIPPLFGISDKAPQPDGYDIPPDDPGLLAKLVEPVLRSGKTYRKY